MNSNHAPTAEEQLFPLEDYLQSKLAEGHNNERSVVSFRIGQLLPVAAALRENREKDAQLKQLHELWGFQVDRTIERDKALAEKDARIAELENDKVRIFGLCSSYRADLRAISDALEGGEALEKWDAERFAETWGVYTRSEVDVIFARIRAIVEGK